LGLENPRRKHVRRRLPIALLVFATAFATALPIALAEEPGTGELGQSVPVVEDGEALEAVEKREGAPRAPSP